MLWGCKVKQNGLCDRWTYGWQGKLWFLIRGVATAGIRGARPPCDLPLPLVNSVDVCVPDSPWAYFGTLCPNSSVIRPNSSNSTVNGDRPELRYSVAPLFAVSGTPHHCPSLPMQKTWPCLFLVNMCHVHIIPNSRLLCRHFVTSVVWIEFAMIHDCCRWISATDNEWLAQLQTVADTIYATQCDESRQFSRIGVGSLNWVLVISISHNLILHTCSVSFTYLLTYFEG